MDASPVQDPTSSNVTIPRKAQDLARAKFGVIVKATAMDSCNSSEDSSESSGWFATTHWTVVIRAKEGDSPEGSEALAKLCRTYWKPVNAYIRRTVSNWADADDLTQQFFARFLEKKHYTLADRDRGRFRSFLLTCVKHFLANERGRLMAQKRGGGRAAISLDQDGVNSLRAEIADEGTGEREYERSWAMTLLGQGRSRVRNEYRCAGKSDRFIQLEQFLPGESSELTYAEVASRLGIPEGTLKSDVHRLKRRYRELLRQEIAQTVGTSGEIDEELRYLIQTLS